MPPTFSTDPGTVVGHIAGGPAALTRAVEDAEDDAAAGQSDVQGAGIGPDDVVVGISASGSAAYVIAAMEEANRAGALTIAITNNPESRLGALAAASIVLQTGPEAIAGSTRMKAAAAQKMALTALSTAVMVKLGKVYGNLMIDLAPSNRKLRARAVRLTQLVTGAGADEAQTVLERCGYRVKVAAVSLAYACSARQAESILSDSGGSLRAALGAKKPGKRS